MILADPKTHDEWLYALLSKMKGINNGKNK